LHERTIGLLGRDIFFLVDFGGWVEVIKEKTIIFLEINKNWIWHFNPKYEKK